jgi:hypothetical protein
MILNQVLPNLIIDYIIPNFQDEIFLFLKDLNYSLKQD